MMMMIICKLEAPAAAHFSYLIVDYMAKAVVNKSRDESLQFPHPERAAAAADEKVFYYIIAAGAK
jgi:hypothetical protein